MIMITERDHKRFQNGVQGYVAYLKTTEGLLLERQLGKRPESTVAARYTQYFAGRPEEGSK